MSQTETGSISLYELPSSDISHEQVTEAARDDDGTSPTRDARHTEASRKRAFILLGASISQLPIWGE
jgi:hypothetical protein